MRSCDSQPSKISLQFRLALSRRCRLNKVILKESLVLVWRAYDLLILPKHSDLDFKVPYVSLFHRFMPILLAECLDRLI